MPVWTWAVGPWRTGPEHDLGHVTDKKITWRRAAGTNHECSFTLPDAGVTVEELQTDVWVFQDGQPISRLRVGSANDAGSALSTKTSVTGLDYREVLKRHRTDTARVWTNTDPAEAAAQLITQDQARTGANLGITVAGLAGPADVQANLSADLDKPVRDNIDTLAGIGQGFDWEIAPTSLLGLQFQRWRPRGTDRGEVIDLGGRAITYQRNPDVSAYGNSGSFTGQAPTTGTAPTRYVLDAPGLATAPEGRWDYTESTDQTTDTALHAAASKSLDSHLRPPVSWTATLARGFWQGPAHIWLGDPIEWVCKRPGRPDIIEILTVEEIAADFVPPSLVERQLMDQAAASDPDLAQRIQPGQPKISLTFGLPQPNSRYKFAQIDRRLNALERR